MANKSLQTKEECPACHYAFIAGFDEDGIRRCPSCRHKYIRGETMDHGLGCSVCTSRRGSNNVYHSDGCPAHMSDGRFVTYYNSTNELTELMRKLNGFDNPNKFRNFMQKHGDLFMDAERKHIISENTCPPSKIACSQGWHDFWNKNKGNWAEPQPYNC